MIGSLLLYSRPAKRSAVSYHRLLIEKPFKEISISVLEGALKCFWHQ